DFIYGFAALKRICFRDWTFAGISSLPDGNWLKRRMYAITSAFCWREIEPGLLRGIETRIRSNISPMLKPSQFAVKAPPVRGGVISAPSRLRPWQVEHASTNTASPRLLCASLYTPSHT